MDMDLEDGMELINAALDAEQDTRLHLQWALQLPYMSREHYVSFAEYKDRVTGANIDLRSEHEILADIAEAEAELQRGGARHGA